MTEPQVLIVEDDHELRELTVRALSEEGFSASGVGTASACAERVGKRVPDALVVDIGLPDADGRDLCQALRAGGTHVPVVFLTARDAVPDRLAGFAAGGDDYLTKPFAIAELAARLRAVLRRAGAALTETSCGLVLDATEHRVGCGEAWLGLTPTEFRLLAALAAEAPRAVTRQGLRRAGWPHGAIVSDNTIDSYVARLRRKLATLPDAPAIVTVHRVGYRIS